MFYRFMQSRTIAYAPVRICQAAHQERFLVRPLNQEEIPKLMELRRKIGAHDVDSSVKTWTTVDPGGINIIENKSGEIVATCSNVKQNEDMYFGGTYYVREQYRGLGIGKLVFKACVDHMGVTNGGTNAVPSIIELYRGLFPTVETDFKCIKNSTTRHVDPEHLSGHLPRGVTIEPFDRSHLRQVFAYDLALVGYERERALELSCQEKNSRTLVAFENGTCVGFGTIKTSCLGAGRVGPLYADDSAVAEVLLRSLLLSLPRVTSFAMMTVSTNVPAGRFLKKLGCPQMEELTRMYRGEKATVDTGKVFALFDLNFALF